MKKVIIIFIFIVCSFYGCEDFFKAAEGEEYIQVTVSAHGNISLKDSDGKVMDLPKPFEYGTIQIEIGKDGSMENKSIVYINELGGFESESVHLKVFKEQPVEAIAYAIEVPDTYIQFIGTDELTWAELHSKVDFGETYNVKLVLLPVLQLK